MNSLGCLARLSLDDEDLQIQTQVARGSISRGHGVEKYEV